MARAKSRILRPTPELQQRIGISLDKIFTPRKIKEAEAAIHRNEKEFFTSVRSELKSLKTTIRRWNSHREKPAHDFLATLADSVFELKSRGGVFGFGLASTVAQ